MNAADVGSLVAERFVQLGLVVWALALLGEALARRVRSGASRRGLWRAATCGLLLLLAGEISGVFASVGDALRGSLRNDPTVRTTSRPESISVAQAAHDLPTYIAAAGDPGPGDPTPGGSETPSQSWGESFDLAGASARFVPAAATESEVSSVLSPAAEANRTSPWVWAAFAAGVCWLAGACLWTGWFLLGRLLWRVRLRRMAEVRDEGLVLRQRRLARRLGLRRTVRLAQSVHLPGPVAFGLWRPVIALPASLSREFSPDEVEAILAHELAHLRARDPAWQLLSDLVCAGLWWHPAAWWIRRRFRAACEWAADEASLEVAAGPSLLAGCLVALARRLSRTPLAAGAAMGGSGRGSNLAVRVERLVELEEHAKPDSRRAPASGWARVTPWALVAAVLFSAVWVRPLNAWGGDRNMRTMKHAWRWSLAGVTALAVGAGLTWGQADGQPDEAAIALAGDGEEGAAKRDGEARKEGERRDGDRPAPPRRDGDRPPAAREGDRPAPPPRREGDRPQIPQEVKQRIEMLQKAMQEAVSKGEKDKAEQLRGELNRIQEHLAREFGPRREGDRPPPPREGDRPPGAREGDRPPPPRGEGGPGDQERRMHHLRMAVENLRAAGLNDLADDLMRRAGRPEGGPRPDGPPREGVRRPDGPPREGVRRPDGPPREGERRPDGPPREGERRPDGPPRESDRRPDGPPREGGFRPGPVNPETMELIRQLQNEVRSLREQIHKGQGAGERKGEERKPEEKKGEEKKEG